jgi:hypothetical protein
MATLPRLLHLAKRASPTKQAARDTSPVDRRRELLVIASVGGKVRHDSGGRLLVVELPESAEPELLKLLPGASLVTLDAELSRPVPDLDEGEALFLEALRIRHSPAYREAKAKRVFGESPEEKLLATASCVRGY